MIPEHQLKELERTMEEWIRSGKHNCVTRMGIPDQPLFVYIKLTRGFSNPNFELCIFDAPYSIAGRVVYSHIYDVICALRSFDADIFYAMRAVFRDEPDIALGIAIGDSHDTKA
jgi:hypothetical protein